MHAVFFMSELERGYGMKDLTIHVFPNKRTAENFVFEKMRKAHHIKVVSGMYLVYGRYFETKAEAIEHVQDHFESAEFFHIYPATDHRKAKTVARTGGA